MQEAGEKAKDVAAMISRTKLILCLVVVGVPIEWGGDWRTFKDGPHFQLPWGKYPG